MAYWWNVYSGARRHAYSWNDHSVIMIIQGSIYIPVGGTSRGAFPWEQYTAVTKLYPTGGVGVIQGLYRRPIAPLVHTSGWRA